MADAYDAVIFLAPLEALHQTALTRDIYTPAFRVELARRLRLLYDKDDLAGKVEASGSRDLAEFIEKSYVATPERPLSQARGLPPLR
jgi:hypothetical protein